jgi:methionine sulfoxide reductase heme-binding subunit
VTHSLAAAVGPSWYWYATRGLGVASLILLTATAVLGIGTAQRWSGRGSPTFVLALVHRNLSLLAVVVVGAHVVTTLLDPFARITLRDAVVPFGAAYRPVWLGLGVAADEVIAAVVVTSLLRDRLGPRLWRIVHWTAYASWPLAVFHSLGTGSDARSPWLIGTAAACTTAVLLSVGERVLSGRVSTLPVRLAAGGAALVLVYGGVNWFVQSPLQPDWALRSGTPAADLSQPAPVHRGPGGFSDPLVGTMLRGADGTTQVALRDKVDTALTVVVRSPTTTESLPVVTIARNSRVVCTVPARVSSTLYAVCGGTRLVIALYGVTAATGSQSVTGRLDASGGLG